MNYFFNLKIFILIFWLVSCFSALARPADIAPSIKPNRIIIFISKNIRPFVEAADGMREVLDEIPGMEVEVFYLDKMGAKASEDLSQKLVQEKDIAVIATIGTEAASFVWRSFQNEVPPKIYSIILNPEKVIGPGPGLCGIALNIPALVQLKMIRQAFGSVHRIGIFYDPSNNEGFYREAAEAALNLGLELVPLKTSSMKDIPGLLTGALGSVDAIWLIPDKTVISESISQYIIKQAIIKRIPVIGYNQFFYESGAVMAFVFDYGALGRQTGELAREIVLRYTSCDTRTPVFQVWLNGGVIEKLGINMPQTLEPPLMMGP